MYLFHEEVSELVLAYSFKLLFFAFFFFEYAVFEVLVAPVLVLIVGLLLLHGVEGFLRAV